MKYAIEHPSHLTSTLRDNPESFLALYPEPEIRVRSKKGEKSFKRLKRWMVVNPGSFDGGYFCHSVNETAVDNLMECRELEEYEKGRWKLSTKKPVGLP